VAGKVDPFVSNVQALSRVRTEDPAANRFQEQLLGALNPQLKNFAAQINVVPQIDSASLPKADVKYSGRLMRVKDDKRPEEIYVCLSTSKGTYEWARIASASF
jgi:hypothetical protein